MSISAEVGAAIEAAFSGADLPKRIGVAVSGGSDSLALLHALLAWGQVPVVAATVDHGLRAEARQEAEQVSVWAAQLGVAHTVLRWTGWSGTGNLQAEARRNRYDLLADWAREVGADCVCLGHTLDDQVETFLMRLNRSSGLEGLAGMSARVHRRGMRFDRPLLGIRRAALQTYLSEKGLAWIDDPSNEDPRFERAKARQALTGLEELGFAPERFYQSILNLGLADRAVRASARDIALKLCKEVDGDLVFDKSGLRQLPGELQHRLLSKALMFVSCEDYPPRSEALLQAFEAVGARRNHSLHGCLVLVSDMTVRVTREWKAVERVTAPTSAVWDGRWRLKGPHRDGLEIRALGEAVKETPWRETGLPRASLLASPAIWDRQSLVAAPLAGLGNGWTATQEGRGKFAEFLLSR